MYKRKLTRAQWKKIATDRKGIITALIDENMNLQKRIKELEGQGDNLIIQPTIGDIARVTT